ncbi:hypothetical protein JCM9279_005571 [Rhodotorula babjevae]
MSRDRKPPPPPLPRLPCRQRSLSTTSATPAPLSPAYRLDERARTITDSMYAYGTEREDRLLAVQEAWRYSRRCAGEVASLRTAVAQEPDNLSLRVKLNEAERRRREAKMHEELAKHALSSPTMQGPSVHPCDDDELDEPRRARELPSASSLVPADPPPPYRSPFSSRTPSPSGSPVPTPARRPTRLSFSRASLSTSTPSSSRPPSPVLRARPLSIATPLSTSTPLSDPLPSLTSFPSHQCLVTSRLAIPDSFVVEELGLIQVATPNLTDLAAIKTLLRVEGVRRGAHAVLGVQTKAWEGAGGGLTGVGRAVRLRKG